MRLGSLPVAQVDGSRWWSIDSMMRPGRLGLITAGSLRSGPAGHAAVTSRHHGVAWAAARRASASYSVVRLTPKVRQIAALLAPASKSLSQ